MVKELYEVDIDRSVRINYKHNNRLKIESVLPDCTRDIKLDFVLAPLKCENIFSYMMYVLGTFDLTASRACIFQKSKDDFHIFQLTTPSWGFILEKRRVKYENRFIRQLGSSSLFALSLSKLFDTKQIKYTDF